MLTRFLRRFVGGVHAAALAAAVPAGLVLAAACDGRDAPTAVRATHSPSTQMATAQADMPAVPPHVVHKLIGTTVGGVVTQAHLDCPDGEWLFSGGYSIDLTARMVDVFVNRPVYKGEEGTPPTSWRTTLRTSGPAAWHIWIVCGRY